MDDFELLGLADDSPPEAAVSTDPAVPPSPSPRWWLALPVALVIGLVVSLSRTDSDPNGEEATTDPTDTTLEGLEEAVTGADGPLTPEQLVASFDGSVLLTGASGREIVANNLATGDVTSLGVRGEPLHFVDGWLVYVQEAAVKVVNLSDGAAEPLVLQSREAARSGFDATVDSGSNLMTVTNYSYADGFEAQATAFVIGSWEEAIEVVETVAWYGQGGVVSSPGNGVYELTVDGYQRRGGGFIVGSNRTVVVTWECDVSLADCHTSVRDRASWEEIGESDALSADPWESLALAPEGFMAVVSDWSDNSTVLVDLESGVQTSIDLTLLDLPYLDRLVGVSDAAVLLAAEDQRMLLVDRATGETSRLELGDGRPARPGVLVSAALPYIAERADG